MIIHDHTYRPGTGHFTRLFKHLHTNGLLDRFEPLLFCDLLGFQDVALELGYFLSIFWGREGLETELQVSK